MGRPSNAEKQKKLQKGRAYMKRYYDTHPDQAERNRNRSREYQRKLREGKRIQGDV